MRTGVRFLTALAVLAFLTIGGRAEAACHFFTVSTLSQIAEGSKASVKVERDAAVADSSVQVSTVNETAKAPGDFTAFNQRVSFTGSTTEKTIQIPTKEDTTPESSETFSVKVSNGMGCQVNQNFQYGDPAKITIKDDDAATPKPSTPKPPTPAPIAAPVTTPTASPTPTPTPTPSATPEETDEATPTPTFAVLAEETEDDDGFPWLPVGAVAGFLAAAGGALMLTRMRRGV